MLREIAILLGSTALLPAANADLILHNGKVVTVDSRFTIQQAVAIRSGAITATPATGAVGGRRPPAILPRKSRWALELPARPKSCRESYTTPRSEEKTAPSPSPSAASRPGCPRTAPYS